METMFRPTRREWPLPRLVLGGSQRVGAFCGLPALIRQLGVNPADALRRTGLASDALDHPDNRVPYAAVAQLLHESAGETRCPHIGLLAGRMWYLADLGIVGDLVRNSRTVGEALRKLTLYQHLNSEGAVGFLREVAGVVDKGTAIYGAEIPGVVQLYDAYMRSGTG